MENRQETSMLQIKIGGQTKTYPAGITYQEIVKEFQEDSAHAIVLVKADGRLQELHRKPMRDCGVEPITVAQPEGFRAYQRSMTLLMLKAMYHVAGHENVEKIGIHWETKADRAVSGGSESLHERDFEPESSYYKTQCGDRGSHQPVSGIRHERQRKTVPLPESF